MNIFFDQVMCYKFKSMLSQIQIKKREVIMKFLLENHFNRSFTLSLHENDLKVRDFKSKIYGFPNSFLLFTCLIKSMNIFMVTLFTILIFYTYSQLLSVSSLTLSEMKNTNYLSDDQKQAVQFLIRSYPYLSNSRNLTITTLKNPVLIINIPLYHFYMVFYWQKERISLITTLYQSQKGGFISLSSLLKETNYDKHNPEQQNENSYILTNNHIQFIKNTNLGNKQFPPFQSNQQGNVTNQQKSIAISYLCSIHPPIKNYELESFASQVGNETTFFIKMKGFDQITEIQAVIYLDENMEPYLEQFSIKCKENSQNDIFNCTQQYAYSLFSAIQALILLHPQLLQYSIANISIDDNINQVLCFLITFENRQLSTRALAQIALQKDWFTIQAYYIYYYPFGNQ